MGTLIADQTVVGRRQLIALCAGTVISQISIYILPILAGAIVEGYGVSEPAVGYVMSVQLGALGIVALAIAPFLLRLRPGIIVVLAVLAIVAGNGISALAGGLPWLVFSRGLVGCGEGALVALVNGLAARLPAPHRTFPILFGAKATFSMLLFIVLPQVIASFGAKGTFLAVAGLAALLSPLLLWLGPALRAEELPAPPKVRHAGSGLPIGALPLLIGWALFQMGQNSMWTYVERLAVRIGISNASVGHVLIMSSIAAIMVTVAVAWHKQRTGYLLPIALAALMSAGSSLTFSAVDGFGFYLLNNIAFSCALYLAYPYMLSLSADVDRTGRVSAAMPAFQALGSTVGPATAGFVLWLSGSFAYVGVFAASVTLASLILVVRPARQIDLAKRRSLSPQRATSIRAG